MRAWAILLTFSLSGCFYVSKDEFLEYWDHDGDGVSLEEDCNDFVAEVHPFAADFRGDGCDADCGREPDADGDDWPDDADCGPDDATIFPCAEDIDGDGIDSDCDGLDSARTDACPTGDPDYETTPELPADCGGAQ